MATESSHVLRLADIDAAQLRRLLAEYHLTLELCPDSEPVPGSFWGDEEAGLKGDTVYVRRDTPLHSILHEACHFICLDEERRKNLDTNAGSDDDEECAVCYLQVLLSDRLDCLGRARMFADMDAWGYSFRLGSSQTWFEEDAEDARLWLLGRGLIAAEPQPADHHQHR
jgi:hypothetical protein